MLKSHYHCLYRLKYHLVLLTKNQELCLTPEMIKALELIVKDITKNADVNLTGFNSGPSYIHLTLDVHPNIMPSKFVNNLKTITSRFLRRDFTEHLNQFYSEPTLWARGYCILTDSNDAIDAIASYTDNGVI